MKTSSRVFVALLLSLSFMLGCLSSPAPRDFPILPLPAETEIVDIMAIRVEQGILLPDDQYQLLVEMWTRMIEERNILRAEIEKYNEWAAKGGD